MTATPQAAANRPPLINVRNPGRPVILVLDGNHPADWQIRNNEETEILTVYLLDNARSATGISAPVIKLKGRAPVMSGKDAKTFAEKTFSRPFDQLYHLSNETTATDPEIAENHTQISHKTEPMVLHTAMPSPEYQRTAAGSNPFFPEGQPWSRRIGIGTDIPENQFKAFYKRPRTDGSVGKRHHPKS